LDKDIVAESDKTEKELKSLKTDKSKSKRNSYIKILANKINHGFKTINHHHNLESYNNSSKITTIENFLN
jgi:hypothetical protein